jgi:hypothetical protein
MLAARRFPPPWTIEENNDACFIVKDRNGRRWRMSTSRMTGATCSGEPANQGRGAADDGEIRQLLGLLRRSPPISEA